MNIYVPTMAFAHEPENACFSLTLGQDRAVVEYQWNQHSPVLTHTWVPETLRGKGVGRMLILFTLEFFRLQRARFGATCPFVLEFLKRNPRYRENFAETTL